MVAEILKVYPGRRRAMVLAKDRADGTVKGCWVDLREDIGQWIASLCQRADRPVILTVNPSDPWGYEIVDAELLPTEAA